jgi:hypothetical protein
MPWLAIAGNHDIGESPLAIRLQQPINVERMSRWQRHYGPSRWCRDIGAWRLIGIDTALLGSGDPEEEAQQDFLERALRKRSGKPVMLFQHLPPFENNADDTGFTAAAVPYAPRVRLLETYLRHGVTVIACGHLHVYRQMEYRGIQIVWAPATSFFNIVEKQRSGLGVPRAGYVEWRLEGRSIGHRLAEPPLMITHDFGAWNAGVVGTYYLSQKIQTTPNDPIEDQFHTTVASVGNIPQNGAYTVSEGEKTIFVKIVASTFANLAGGPEQKRIVTSLTADELHALERAGKLDPLLTNGGASA